MKLDCIYSPIFLDTEKYAYFSVVFLADVFPQLALTYHSGTGPKHGI